MVPVNPYTLTYEHVVCCGIPMIFTDLRIKKDMLPDGLFSYDVRHSEEGDVCSIERRVLVNFYGTVISKKPIEKIEDLHEDVDIFNDECDENFYFDGGCLTLDEYINMEDDMTPEERISAVVEELNNQFRQSGCGYLSLGEILATLPKVDKMGCWAMDTKEE